LFRNKMRREKRKSRGESSHDGSEVLRRKRRKGMCKGEGGKPRVNINKEEKGKRKRGGPQRKSVFVPRYFGGEGEGRKDQIVESIPEKENEAGEGEKIGKRDEQG